MNRKPLLVTLVLLAGACVASFFGLLASLMYGIPEQHDQFEKVGPWWGAATGLIAGVVWCAVMLRGSRRRGFVAAGALTGLGVGVLSTVLLHAVLIARADRVEPMVPLVGLGCGIVAGVIVGAICGAICRTALSPAETPQPLGDPPQ
jgi:hypothetical protein